MSTASWPSMLPILLDVRCDSCDGVVELVVAHYNQANKIYAYSGNDSFTTVWTSVETTPSTGVDVGDGEAADRGRPLGVEQHEQAGESGLRV